MIKYTKELLEPIIKESLTWAEVTRKLGLKYAGGTFSHLYSRAQKFEIDFSHFLGQGHGKGKSSHKKKDALEFCFKGSMVNSDKLRRRLIDNKYKEEKCENCGATEWCGQKIPLELDHIDNDHFNNEFINLKILCPNCHALKTNINRKGRGETGQTQLP